MGGLDHLKRSTNLTLKLSINVDVTLNYQKVFYLLAKYITTIVDLILNSQKILYHLTKQTQVHKMDEKITMKLDWLHPYPNTHRMDEERTITNHEGWLASSPSKHTNAYAPMPLQ